MFRPPQALAARDTAISLRSTLDTNSQQRGALRGDARRILLMCMVAARPESLRIAACNPEQQLVDAMS